ncbi:glycosyltransferase family 4 protein [Singulisphaera sp. PoT]|uniref:glycosyltransferase family 4 protein n=1 Tax=Singulisphaera sp. PoT TaxID=3411797 RepID=UPI003BF4B494
MRPLRIVLVMLEPPLPFGNAAARWFYVLLKGLVARGHSVTAYAVCSKPEDIAKARDLFPSTQYDLRLYPFPERSGLLSKLETFRKPYSYMFGDDMKADFNRRLAEGFDILHLEQLWGGWLALDNVDKALVSVHYLSAIDLGERKPDTLSESFGQALLLRTERRLIRKLRHFRTVSSRLEPLIREWNPKADVSSVPLGLDSSLYPFIPEDRRSTTPIVTLIGTMGWAPSYSAAIRMLKRLWPSIKERVPGAKLEIVGWSARAKLAEYLNLTDVTIEENVPDIQPYFERASVLVYAPSRGSGMKIKIQEAMAFGVPVVTTSEGVEGLEVQDGVEVGLAEDDAGLIDRTVALLRDPALQERQRRAARALIEAQCGPEVTLEGMERVYARILERSGENFSVSPAARDR